MNAKKAAASDPFWVDAAALLSARLFVLHIEGCLAFAACNVAVLIVDEGDVFKGGDADFRGEDLADGGAEGLDFHKYCERLVHYTAPVNVIELEQKNGRIDRYHSLAQRRNWSLPGNLFAKAYTLKDRARESGGMIDGWDAGENNLHYYFIYTRYTGERDYLETLFQEQKNYRMHIGVNQVIERTSLNLCPFLKQQKQG